MLISHDLGTSGNKASLHRATGELVATASASYPTRHGRNTTAQRPHDWWRAVVDSTRALMATPGVDAADVKGICVAGQMMAAVLLDERYEPVWPAMIWSDQRATDEAAAITAAVGAERAFALTGHRVAANYTLPKVAWLRDHEPEAFADVAHVCVTKDYVNLRLTGRLAADHSDASSTAAYDLAAGTWSAEMLDAAGIDPALWPEVVASTDVLGPLTPSAARELGLSTSVLVVAGGGDGPMANVAAASLAPEDAGYVCLGTSAWYATTTTAPIADPAQRGFTYRHIVPGLFAPCATTQAGAASLGWLADALGGGLRPADLAREASGVTAGEDGLFFLPHLLGERTPWWNPDRRRVRRAAAGAHARAPRPGRHGGRRPRAGAVPRRAGRRRPRAAAGVGDRRGSELRRVAAGVRRPVGRPGAAARLHDRGDRPRRGHHGAGRPRRGRFHHRPHARAGHGDLRTPIGFHRSRPVPGEVHGALRCS